MPLFTKADRSALYIHVPKTGGTSVENFFLSNGFAAEYLDTGGGKSINHYRRCPPQHMHAEQLQLILRPLRCNYIFATVREPKARIISEYRMRARGRAEFPSLPSWLDQAFKRYSEDTFVFENHLRPQSQFIIPGCDVFRQEDGFGPALIERIESQVQVKLEYRSLPHNKPDMQVLVPPEDIFAVSKRIRDFYWQDYAAFYPEHTG